jgi:Spy/CpxP family protein refolding chaperone
MNNSLTKSLAVLAAAGFISLSSAAAFAQAGPRGHHAGDASFGIAALKGQLNLNTSQQTMWDSAVAQTKAARGTGRANMQKIHDAMSAELAKAEPDLAAVAATADDVQASNGASRKQVRNMWLAMYATFTPDQKAIVRDALKQRMARMETVRQKMLQRQGG